MADTRNTSTSMNLFDPKNLYYTPGQSGQPEVRPIAQWSGSKTPIDHPVYFAPIVTLRNKLMEELARESQQSYRMSPGDIAALAQIVGQANRGSGAGKQVAAARQAALPGMLQPVQRASAGLESNRDVALAQLLGQLSQQGAALVALQNIMRSERVWAQRRAKKKSMRYLSGILRGLGLNSFAGSSDSFIEGNQYGA